MINETGNLIGEIMAMAEQGREFDPARIRELAQRVVKRVEQSNRVVKILNRFAHSAEEEADCSDGPGVLELMVGLYEWQAGFKKVRLSLEPLPEGDPPRLGVNPFILERILWSALEAAVAEVSPGGLIRLSLDWSRDKLSLKLSGEFEHPPALPPRELLSGASVQARGGERGALFGVSVVT